jgi:2-polyprenyl-6-methoxyphenol hydroxylase-like FAD-dependent oxidoreductase
VGGGPAGSATALLLARAGFDVVLLDKQQFPRAKPCGDCLSPGANVLLKRLGVWDDVLAAQPARLQGWLLDCGAAAFSARFSALEGGAVTPDDTFSVALARENLDAILLDHARSAGVDVRTGCRVSDLNFTQDVVNGVHYVQESVPSSLTARLVIGADGLRSRVARILNAYRRAPRIHKLSLTTHIRGLQNISEFGEMYVRPEACLGIARVDSSVNPLCNVTVVLQRTRGHAQGRRAILRAALTDLGRSDIADLIADEETIIASGPFDWPVRQSVFDGAALVGDAAGYFDPFTGQGIFHALSGALLLGDAAAQALRHSTAKPLRLDQYGRAQQAMKTRAHRLQRAIDFVCARPALTTPAFRAFGKLPRLAATLVAVTGDLQPARALLSPLTATRFVRAAFDAAPR